MLFSHVPAHYDAVKARKIVTSPFSAANHSQSVIPNVMSRKLSNLRT